MQFEGEHLWIGKIGHFFVLLAFVSALIATIGYFIAAYSKNEADRFSWNKFSRISFYVQTASVLGIFACIFYICYNHYFEYLYAYKHTSKELEFKYLLACIWEDQGGSFMLWSICHSLLGVFLIQKAKEWESPVMGVISLAQVFLAMMVMGAYIFGTKIGNSPFVLTRDEINGPIFSMPNYLSLIKDGVGLNVLLRNYWMVIHPPVLFLGFASTIVPFAFAFAGLQTKKYGEWVKVALPYALFSGAVLGVGIMMGGKWAYESLSFGGYWAWDPVENASLVPWMIMVAGLHTMVIFKATGHSLKATYVFSILSFVLILYSTFLTRTGILGDTSVHAFTEAGKAMNLLILSFLLFFFFASFIVFFLNYKKIPTIAKEENTNSREFWMFIGSLILFLSSIFIIGKTSAPVINKIFGTQLAPSEDVEFSYNKVMIMVAILLGIFSAITQYFKYKGDVKGTFLKKIVLPTLIAAIITAVLAVVYPITFYKHGAGFLGAIYLGLFASIYAFIANAGYIWTGLNGKFKAAGGSIAHIGFAIMIAGMLISAGNRKVISEEKIKSISIPMGIDPLTKQQDNAAENINLIRQVPNKMGEYMVTYLKDSLGHEAGRRFYQLYFERKDPVTNAVTESFYLSPDVYMMKDNNMSSNPDTRSYFTHDVFTYISYTLDPSKNTDTAQFKISEVAEGDTIFYSKGFMILEKVIKNPTSNKFNIPLNGPAVVLDIAIQTQDSMKYHAYPMITVDSIGINQFDDTVYAQNLYVKFAGITEDQKKLKIGVKESSKLLDFVTLKAFIFPYINLVWIGLVIMSVGFILGMIYRAGIKGYKAIAILTVITIALFYMFMFAGT